MTYTIDGNMYMCTGPGFKNLQESDAGFGVTCKEAFLDYWRNAKTKPRLIDCTPDEQEWVQFIDEELL